MTVRWLTAFIDLPGPAFEDGCAFWAAVTGYTLSGRRGDNDQFVTLLPEKGDAFLRLQRVDEGRPAATSTSTWTTWPPRASRPLRWAPRSGTIMARTLSWLPLPGCLSASSPTGGRRSARSPGNGRAVTGASWTSCASTSRPMTTSRKLRSGPPSPAGPRLGVWVRPDARGPVRAPGAAPRDPAATVAAATGRRGTWSWSCPPRPVVRRRAHRAATTPGPGRQGRPGDVRLDHPARRAGDEYCVTRRNPDTGLLG